MQSETHISMQEADRVLVHMIHGARPSDWSDNLEDERHRLPRENGDGFTADPDFTIYRAATGLGFRQRPSLE